MVLINCSICSYPSLDQQRAVLIWFKAIDFNLSTIQRKSVKIANPFILPTVALFQVGQLWARLRRSYWIEGLRHYMPRNSTLYYFVIGCLKWGKQFFEELIFSFSIQNEKVVEVISVMLQRNPMCKLTPEDVRFLQKPGPNSSPSSVYRLFWFCSIIISYVTKLQVKVFTKFVLSCRFALHPKFRGSNMISSISYYFRQNIVHQFATSPKYSSPLPTLRFQVIEFFSFISEFY